MIRLVETSNPSSPSFLDSKFMDLSWWQSRLGRSTHGLGSNRPDLVGAYLLLHWPKSMQKSISLENYLFMSYSLQILQRDPKYEAYADMRLFQVPNVMLVYKIDW